jgi:hypothetical protein
VAFIVGWLLLGLSAATAPGQPRPDSETETGD